MKSLQLNNVFLVMIERKDYFVKYYYSDGHCDLYYDNINNHLQKDDLGHYFIKVDCDQLYPNMRISSKQCSWINLLKIFNHSIALSLIKEKQLHGHVIPLIRKHVL